MLGISPFSRKHHRSEPPPVAEIRRPWVPATPIVSERHATELLEYGMEWDSAAVHAALWEQQDERPVGALSVSGRQWDRLYARPRGTLSVVRGLGHRQL